MTVDRVREKITAVSLFLTLWETKFLRISDFMLLVSQNSNSLANKSCNKPYKFEASKAKPKSSPSKINKNMFRSSVKLPDTRARGKI